MTTPQQCASETCVETFIPRSHHQRYCSKRCRNAARYQGGATNEEAAEALREKGLNPDSWALTRLSRWDAIGPDGPQELQALRAIPSGEGDRALAVSELLSELSQAREALAKERSRTEAFVELVSEHIPDEAVIAPSLSLPVPADGAPHEVHVGLADTQAGKLAWGEGLEELEGYIASWAQQVAAAVAELQAVGPVERLVVHLLGDLIENCGMFDTQAYELDYRNGGQLVIWQVAQVSRMIAGAIGSLYELGVPLRVTSNRGNHGRRAPKKKGETVSHPDDNLDTLVALIVKEMLGQRHIDWEIPISGELSWLTVTDSYGWRVVAHHGDAVGSHTQAKLEQWVLNHEASGTWGKADVILQGHGHHPLTLDVNGIMLVQSGALDPGSPWFLRMKGKATPPSQELLAISAEAGPHRRKRLVFGAPQPRQQA